MLLPFEGAARGRPKLDLLVLRFFPSMAAAQEALQRREVQGLAATLLPQEQPSDQLASLRTLRLPLAEYTVLTFNLRRAPLDDLRLRTALVRGLDRAALIRRVVHGGEPVTTPILPQSWATGEVEPAGPDREAAEAALDAAGWRRGRDGIRRRSDVALQLPIIALDDPQQLAIAEEVARQWNALGIDAQVEPEGLENFRTRIDERDFVVLLNNWSAAADPDQYALWHSSQAADGANYAGLIDKQSDDLLERGRTTLDLEQRTAIYHQWQARWAALVPSLPLFQPVLTYALDQQVRTTGLDEGRLLTSPSARFDTINEWTLATSE
jgi:peptide/nickel transport system substrate-binding protein